MTGAHAECRGALVQLTVAKDGTVAWNGVAFKSEKEMIDRFRQEARAVDQPKILFLPASEIARTRGYDVLMLVQKAGLECVGFSGFGQKQAN
jgi:biopolymer transport protein ExbD